MVVVTVVGRLVVVVVVALGLVGLATVALCVLGLAVVVVVVVCHLAIVLLFVFPGVQDGLFDDQVALLFEVLAEVGVHLPRIEDVLRLRLGPGSVVLDVVAFFGLV